MSSPVLLSLSSFVTLDRNASTPLFVQLAQQIINGIQRGFLATGAKLPGTRIVGDQLNLHRKTVIAAYDELQAQGWIDIIPNKGTFVLQQSKTKQAIPSAKPPLSSSQYPAKTGYDIQTSNILDNPFEENIVPYSFSDGNTDIRLTQVKNLSLQYSSSMNRKGSLKRMSQYHENGSLYFKEQLSNYLNLSRGLHISKYNLLITRSSEMSIYLIAKVVLKPLDKVIVAELSNFAVNMTLLQAGATLETIPLDKEGISITALRDKLKTAPIRMLYITPHHHYPTTVTLSAQRRLELLQLANEYGFVVVEDDYDYDFHYEKAAVLPIASADTNGMVIYTGTFGKSLAPAFRTGFVVAPHNLIQEMNKYLGIIDRQGDIIMEQTLGEMIEEGEIHRHLKKSLKIYRERRDNMSELLNGMLKEYISFDTPNGGLATWVEFYQTKSLMNIKERCLKHGLLVPRHILYQNRQISAMRIGFGHMDSQEMEESFSILKLALESF
ncbi:aminotransferase-like domain-containing protein [Sphingobacterium tabacisoli]|uniref:PLP-dependent aminotransferase family protein n=1 Tax=Sphingobacterium tabacisoli TaxID=2044855 RepID=A0ABW5L4M4_9SPHI|nr:PLP-dependent aminotransferase family protein [Sphingobacterium tabacisoli]